MRLIVAFLACLLGLPAAFASDPELAGLEPIESILERPDGQIDLLEAKLAIDHLISPETEPAAVRLQIDALVTSVKGRIPAGASNLSRINALLSTLYEPGPWNGGGPFQYDLDDPLG